MTDLARCWLDTCLSLLLLQIQAHSELKPDPGVLWSSPLYLHYYQPREGKEKSVFICIFITNLQWIATCVQVCVNPKFVPFYTNDNAFEIHTVTYKICFHCLYITIISPSLTMSMQKSGRCPVIPNTVVLRYFSWPAKSMKVMTFEDFSQILVQSKLPP